IREITVREPMLTVVSVNRQTAAGDDTVSPLIAAAAEALGARAHIVRASVAAGALENALRDGSADAVVTIGGTGEGRGDRAVAVTGGYGAVALHGMAIRRGETAALASVGARPVLMLPGRLDAALAVWLLVGRPMIARLTGFSGTGRTFTAPLTRKLVSSIGLADVAFVLLSA
ncbi:MAG: molybdopterin-binding protein, partial [Rhizobiales bacterium]|nr:molybdopterin-binding protein [Hyphomicrobiales bacterium]